MFELSDRHLSSGEEAILAVIEEHYGSQNRGEHIVFTEDGDAVIWVRDRAGVIPIAANLTNLARWIGDGTIADEAELKRDWLKLTDT